MGLSNAISGAIVMLVMLAMMFAFLIIYETSLTVNDAAVQNFDTENKVYHTSISIASASESEGNPDFTFPLASNDEEKLWDFDNFDVIVEYDGENPGAPTRYVESLIYSGSCSGQPAAGNWCIDSWTGDNMDPNILNNGESITIWATMNDDLWDTGILIINVITDTGVIASYSETIS